MAAPVNILFFELFCFTFTLSYLVFGRAGISILISSILAIFVEVVRIPPVDKKVSERILEPGKVLVVGHRGVGKDGPENTLAAIRLAKQHGADAVEIDLEFTKDGHAILLHDETVDRTTNGSGRINDMLFNDVKQLDASIKHDERHKYPEERVPTLEEALVECIKLGLKVFIDVKGYPDQSANAISELFQRHKELYHLGVVCSFHPTVVYQMRKIDPNIVTALTWRYKHMSEELNGAVRPKLLWQQWLYPVCDYILELSMEHFLWYLLGPSVFMVNKGSVSRVFLRRWNSRGITVIAWTVNDQLEKDYFQNYLKCSYLTDSLLGSCAEQT